ncbi:MAG: Molybdenum-pterin-binding protein MopA [Burkholderiaceae bacterium]|nr:Molybdenum-pterin-binding protein MopA [Burkholderiaceae bacterium]
MASGRRRKRNQRLQVQGSLWFTVGGESLGGRDRIDLLRALAEHGSITRAARAHGISYKAAWDAIDAMNTLAGEPLVERSAGGRGGGSSRLSARGLRLIERFEQIDAAHQRFLNLLDEQAIDLERPFSLLRVLNMKTSARNQFVGTVSALRAGAVNDEVEITLPGGQRIVAVVTQASTQALGLRTKMTVIALVKSSSIVVATDLDGAKVSARNQLAGTIGAVTPGAVNSEVVIDLDGGDRIAAIVTEGSARALGLKPGVRATALFKATSVILAVAA